MGRMAVTRHEKSEFANTFLLRRFFVTSGVIPTALIGAANSLTFDDGRKKSKIVIRAPPRNPFYGPAGHSSRRLVAFKSSARGFSPLETFGDATKLVKTMWVAIQKDPTIDAVFSIGSCCGPGMVAAREQLGDRVCGMHFDTIDLFAAIRSPRRSTPKRAQHL
jgi:simple sugar transport system substrate-binding protein